MDNQLPSNYVTQVPVSLDELIRMTLFRKYEEALETKKAVQKYQLRRKVLAAPHPNLSADFKAAVLDMLQELNPHLPKEKQEEIEKYLKNPDKLDMKDFYDAITFGGIQLSRMGILK